MRQLVPAMQYVFRVRATSSVGAGDWSPPATFCTSAAAPSAPTHVAAFAAAVDTPDLTGEETDGLVHQQSRERYIEPQNSRRTECTWQGIIRWVLCLQAVSSVCWAEQAAMCSSAC